MQEVKVTNFVEVWVEARIMEIIDFGSTPRTDISFFNTKVVTTQNESNLKISFEHIIDCRFTKSNFIVVMLILQH